MQWGAPQHTAPGLAERARWSLGGLRGTEYDVLVYGELGALVHTEAGLTGTSGTYPEAEETAAELGLGWLANHLRVRIRNWGAPHTHEAIW